MGESHASRDILPSGTKKKLAKATLNQKGKDLLAMYMGEALDPKERERLRLVTLAQAIAQARILAAREDPNAFIEYCFSDSETGAPLEQAQIHRDMQAAMASGDDVLMELPRDHGKTTQLEGHAIWRLGRNPNLRIKIVCASDGKAVERLFAIIQHIRINERVHEVFPNLKPAEYGDWTKHKIVVRRDYISRDASIEALGVLSTATGGRADVLFADDVVDRRNALEQPKLRENVKNAWRSDWSNLLEPNAQIIYCGTPWHTADLTHELKRNPTYKILSCPIGKPGDPYAPVWEEKWPREQLKRRRLKIGQVEYDRGFRLRALSGDFATVLEDWIDYWDSPPDLGSLICFQAFDVSSGTAADWFATVTVGVDPRSMEIFVLEAWHAKLTFLQRANAIAQQAARWNPAVQGLEQETMKSLSQYLDETTLLNVLPLRPHLPKAVRLMSVTPPLERGQVKFNPALNPKNLANPDEHGDLVGELIEFPLAANDDLVDVFVYAIQLAQVYGLREQQGIELGLSVIGQSNGNGEAPQLFPDSDNGHSNGNGNGAGHSFGTV